MFSVQSSRSWGNYMNLQVLVSTMHQKDHGLLNKMNIQSDAIIVNQCNMNKFEEFDYKGYNIRFLSLAERGVGLSRNTGLMRVTADICIFADDDVVYDEGYRETVIEAFKNNPKADVILFNVLSTNPERPSFVITKENRIRFYNIFRYGTFRIAVRMTSIYQSNISFSLLFGGGAKYSAGEDSLFLNDCLRSGLKVFSSPQNIGIVTQSESTWFKGYTDKYFIDKGVFYATLSKKWSKLLISQFAIRHRNLFEKDKTVIEAYKLMCKGINLIK